jgi:DNA-binding CsgD family transcriptional regulator/tetratricopeptide (TPR) repeat protein
MLRGRRSECAVLDGMLDAARSGRSAGLVVRGEAGIGKTALLEYAAESASDMTLVRAVGMESESDLAFATLHQLCAPLLDGLDRLPAPQRDALAVTFGLCSGAVPDRFFVGLAVLALLSDMAQDRPLLCVVDDAQWLDRASAQALGFVARRLLVESVVVLFGARDPGEELRGLPELRVEGLRDAEAHELLASAIPGPLDERVREQIVAETQGNPLALLEVPRGLSPAQLAGGFGLLGALSVSSWIEESVLRRLEALPETTRRLLSVASAEALGDPALLWRAASRLQIARRVLDPAQTAGLVEVGARVRFRHPLVRSAVYSAATPDLRREAHRALAEATDAETDPDRRAWHLAHAAASPDEDVAAELERGAVRAQSRGGLAAAAAFLERAVALTPDHERRAQRALAAAQAKYQAGAPDAALALLGVAEVGPLDELERARVQLLRAETAYSQHRGSDAPPLLLRAARQLESLDATLARATYRDALEAATWAGGTEEGVGVVEVAQAVLAMPPSDRPSATDLLLTGVAIQCTEDFAAGVPTLKRALSGVRAGEISAPEQVEWSVLTYRTAVDLWDDESWFVMAERFVELARQTGALPLLHFALNARVVADAFAGTLAAGSARMEELRAVCDVIGSELPPYSPLALAAWRGREAEVNQLLAATTNEAAARGETLAFSAARWAAAVLYNAHGRYDEALAAAEQAVEYRHLGFSGWSLAELTLAAARTGNSERAAAAVRQLARTADACGSEWALGVVARSRALLSTGVDAEELYREAIERLHRTRVRAELARAYLHHGEWLRGERRQREAREQLRTAREMFMAMGAEAFAERAERELLATGERVRKHRGPTREHLTPQEAQIAGLARDGFSNAEIGERLFTSSRTVEYHLHKVFNKLGISSRGQLVRTLRDEPRSELPSDNR